MRSGCVVILMVSNSVCLSAHLPVCLYPLYRIDWLLSFARCTEPYCPAPYCNVLYNQCTASLPRYMYQSTALTTPTPTVSPSFPLKPTNQPANRDAVHASPLARLPFSVCIGISVPSQRSSTRPKTPLPRKQL
ncbi:hypothetical protein BC567DRAFT_231128 [Phyllosticta citribraziliensis]